MDTTACYRIPVALQFAWAIILVGGLLFLPETPRFNIKKGRFDKAAESLSRLRRLPVDHPSLVEELAEVRANHEYEMSIGKGTYADCFKGTVGKRLDDWLCFFKLSNNYRESTSSSTMAHPTLRELASRILSSSRSSPTRSTWYVLRPAHL